MNAARLLLGLVALVCCLVGIDSIWPDWATTLRRRGRADKVSAASRGALSPTEVKQRFVTQRIKAKERIIVRLLQEDIGLLEAAAWFRYLNETPAEHPDLRWRDLPGASDGEKLCRQVILWTSHQGQRRIPPSQLETLCAALEKELKEHIAQHGTVKLPE